MAGFPLDVNTFLILATVVLAVLVLRNWYRKREERRETARKLGVEDVAEIARSGWEKLKDIAIRMSPYMVAFAALLAFIFIPGGDNKLRFLAGVAFGLIFMEYVLERLMAYNTFYAVNHEYEDMGVFDISNIMLPLYRIVDREGKPASMEYSMWDRHGRAWIVDAVDLHHRIIVVNPITSSMEFTKNFRLLMDELITKANVYMNQRNRYKSKLEYEKKAEAVELLEQLHDIDAWTPGDEEAELEAKLERIREEHDDDG